MHDVTSGAARLRADVGPCWWQELLQGRLKQADLPKADVNQLWDVIKAQRTVLKGFWDHPSRRTSGPRLAECPHCTKVTGLFGQVGHAPY